MLFVIFGNASCTDNIINIYKCNQILIYVKVLLLYYFVDVYDCLREHIYPNNK